MDPRIVSALLSEIALGLAGSVNLIVPVLCEHVASCKEDLVRKACKSTLWYIRLRPWKFRYKWFWIPWYAPKPEEPIPPDIQLVISILEEHAGQTDLEEQEFPKGRATHDQVKAISALLKKLLKAVGQEKQRLVLSALVSRVENPAEQIDLREACIFPLELFIADVGEFLPILASVLGGTENSDMKYAAAWVIQVLGPLAVDALPVLLEVITQGEENAQVVKTSACAVGRIGVVNADVITALQDAAAIHQERLAAKGVGQAAKMLGLEIRTALDEPDEEEWGEK